MVEAFLYNSLLHTLLAGSIQLINQGINNWRVSTTFFKFTKKNNVIQTNTQDNTKELIRYHVLNVLLYPKKKWKIKRVRKEIFNIFSKIFVHVNTHVIIFAFFTLIKYVTNKIYKHFQMEIK